MAHIRTQIRELMKEVLDGSLPAAGYTVYSSRKSAVNHVPGKAQIDMRFSNDQTQGVETMSDDRTHTASMYLRCHRSGPEEELDDLLDGDEVLIVDAIESGDWLDLLEAVPEVMQVNFTDDATGGDVLAGMVLRVEMEYRIERGDPETAIS